MEKHPESKLWDLCGGDLEKVEGKTAFDGQALGDATAKRVVSRYVKYLAEGLVNICNEFRPEAIVLGGGVCGAGDVLLKPLKRRINRYIYGGTKYAPVKVVIASLATTRGCRRGQIRDRLRFGAVKKSRRDPTALLSLQGGFMFLECLKNYVRCVKYLLIAMGIVYLFFILACVALAQGAFRVVAEQGSEVYRQIAAYLTERFAGGRTLSVYVNGGFWQETLSDLVAIVRAGGETSAAELLLLLAGFVFLVVLGVKLAEGAGHFFYKREFGDENTRYGLLNWIVKLLIGVAFTLAFSFFALFWKYGGWVVIAVYLLVNASQTLYSTWFVYFSKEDRKKFGSPKNVCKVALIMLICYALFAALFFVLYRFLSPVLAFVVAVPLFVYTDQVILITTLTYFQKTI